MSPFNRVKGWPRKPDSYNEEKLINCIGEEICCSLCFFKTHLTKTYNHTSFNVYRCYPKVYWIKSKSSKIPLEERSNLYQKKIHDATVVADFQATDNDSLAINRVFYLGEASRLQQQQPKQLIAFSISTRIEDTFLCY